MIAHEVAHQWWGGQLNPENREGADMLTETLAQYTELVLLEKMWGQDKVQNALKVEQELYFSARGQEPEKPLYKVADQSYVSYHKGSLVMHALKEKIGEQKLNLALRRLLQKHTYPSPPPISLDLLKQLNRVTLSEIHKQMDEWFRKVIVYDLKLEDANYKKLPDDRYLVTLKINASKVEDFSGKEVHDVLADSVAIAIYAEENNDLSRLQRPDYIKQYYLGNKTTEVSMIVEKQPKEVAVDPYFHFLDENRQNNWKTMTKLP